MNDIQKAASPTAHARPEKQRVRFYLGPLVRCCAYPQTVMRNALSILLLCAVFLLVPSRRNASAQTANYKNRPQRAYYLYNLKLVQDCLQAASSDTFLEAATQLLPDRELYWLSGHSLPNSSYFDRPVRTNRLQNTVSVTVSYMLRPQMDSVLTLWRQFFETTWRD